VREYEIRSELPNVILFYMIIHFNFLDFFTIINRHFTLEISGLKNLRAVEGVGTRDGHLPAM
jgi:hypothetical protein